MTTSTPGPRQDDGPGDGPCRGDGVGGCEPAGRMVGWVGYAPGTRAMRFKPPGTRGPARVLRVPLRPVHAVAADPSTLMPQVTSAGSDRGGSDRGCEMPAVAVGSSSDSRKSGPTWGQALTACGQPLGELQPVGPWPAIPLILRCPRCRRLVPTPA